MSDGSHDHLDALGSHDPSRCRHCVLRDATPVPVRMPTTPDGRRIVSTEGGLTTIPAAHPPQDEEPR
jgi:hypothetical protein